MTSQVPSNINQTPFLPTAIFLPQENEVMLIKLNEFCNKVCLYLNQREISNYPLTEIQDGQRWFSNVPPSATNPQNASTRSGFRKVFQFGAIPAGTTLTVAHGIQSFTTMTHIYGDVIAGGFNLPLPYVDATLVTNQVSVFVDNVNYYVVNGATADDIVSGVLTLEYLRN